MISSNSYAGGYCFTAGGPECGNGIVETGEQCDCGSATQVISNFPLFITEPAYCSPSAALSIPVAPQTALLFLERLAGSRVSILDSQRNSLPVLKLEAYVATALLAKLSGILLMILPGQCQTRTSTAALLKQIVLMPFTVYSILRSLASALT